MIPYFYNLEKQIFSDSLIDELEVFVKQNLYSFIEYQGDDGEIDGNNYYYSKELKEIPEIKSFIKTCSLECFPMIVLHKPNSRVIKHIDDPYKRNTLIITPIHPRTDYPPTYFWSDDRLAATCEFSKGSPVLFNTQMTHSLNNDSDEYRFNLQICFDENIETVLKLYQLNMLFQE